MFDLFPPHLADFYKCSHIRQYPEGTEYVYSNFTPRADKNFECPNFDHKVTFFGLQGICQWLLIDLWNKNFFDRPKKEVIDKYKQRMDRSLGLNSVSVEHIGALHDLGYLPVRIKALPEGSRVDIRVPLYTIINTDPKFFWVTNYLETQLSAELWKMITSATLAYEYRKLLDKFASDTGSDRSFVDWQGHDFSMRGMSGVWDATQSGAAHLLSFRGTDTISAIDYIEQYYDANDYVSGSIPASEHSVVTIGGKEDELETLYRLITKVYPKGMFSFVADSYDHFKVITDYAQRLKYIILNRDGKLVFRPDCYDEETQILTPQGWKYFRDIDENQLVAQVLQDGSHQFVKPLKYVSQKYEGDMYHFKDHHGKIDLLVTPNHRMVWLKEGKFFIQEAEISGGYWNKDIIRTARALDKGRTLSPLERIKIAFQADGSFCTRTKSTIRFSFSKKRKIERLKYLADMAGITHASYELKDKRVEIHLSIDASLFQKDLDWVDTSDLCSNWCNEFLEELSHWDSSVRNKGRFKFDTTIKKVIDVVELVAISAGRGVVISQASDDRKDHFSDIYTAHIMKDNMFDGHCVRKNKISYNGNVYCVQVPSGMLLVKRGRGTAVCGNSGDPFKIIVGDPNAPHGSPEYKGSVECLWDIFGGTYTSKGYRTLDSHVGLIYGDSISLETARMILEGLKGKGFSSQNIVYGIGSFSYQYCTRDTFGTAIKATYGVVNGVPREIYKDPKTDSGMKKSAKGLLRVEFEDGKYVLYDQQTPEQERQGLLETLFENGKLLRKQSFKEIREFLHNPILQIA
jgi:nicotinic acid phosphoribosyltransferase